MFESTRIIGHNIFMKAKVSDCLDIFLKLESLLGWCHNWVKQTTNDLKAMKLKLEHHMHLPVYLPCGVFEFGWPFWGHTKLL